MLCSPHKHWIVKLFLVSHQLGAVICMEESLPYGLGEGGLRDNAWAGSLVVLGGCKGVLGLGWAGMGKAVGTSGSDTPLVHFSVPFA